MTAELFSQPLTEIVITKEKCKLSSSVEETRTIRRVDAAIPLPTHRTQVHLVDVEVFKCFKTLIQDAVGVNDQLIAVEGKRDKQSNRQRCTTSGKSAKFSGPG